MSRSGDFLLSEGSTMAPHRQLKWYKQLFRHRSRELTHSKSSYMIEALKLESDQQSNSKDKTINKDKDHDSDGKIHAKKKHKKGHKKHHKHKKAKEKHHANIRPRFEIAQNPDNSEKYCLKDIKTKNIICYDTSSFDCKEYALRHKLRDVETKHLNSMIKKLITKQKNLDQQKAVPFKVEKINWDLVHTTTPCAKTQNISLDHLVSHIFHRYDQQQENDPYLANYKELLEEQKQIEQEFVDAYGIMSHEDYQNKLEFLSLLGQWSTGVIGVNVVKIQENTQTTNSNSVKNQNQNQNQNQTLYVILYRSHASVVLIIKKNTMNHVFVQNISSTVIMIGNILKAKLQFKTGI